MLRYDKDRERVMQAKKREVVAELEAQKQDAIKEMYEVLEIIMSKMQGLLADYNHIRLTIDERFEAVLKGSEDAIEETNEKVNEHLIRIENEANEKFANVDITLNEKISSFTSTINGKIEELEALQTVVTELKNQCENMLDGTATEEDLAELEARVTELMESAGVQSDWAESDVTSKAFVKNKTHYGEFTKLTLLEKTKILKIPNYSHTTSPMMGSLGFEFEPTGYGFFELTVNNVVYNLPIRKADYFIPYRVVEGNTTTLNNTLAKNIFVAGDTGGESYQFSPDFIGDPFFMYQDPNDNTWHLIVKNSSYQSYEIEIKVLTASNIFPLAPNYLDANIGNGKILTCVNGKSSWVDPVISSYDSLEFNTLLSGEAVNNGETHSRWGYPILNIEMSGKTFSLIEGETYYFSVNTIYGILSKKCTCYSYSDGGTAIDILSGLRLVTNNVKVYLQLSYDNDKKYFGGAVPDTIEFSVDKYERVYHEGTINPVNVAPNPVEYSVPVYYNGSIKWGIPIIVSSNGTPFKIKVNDDGTLSTEAVTE